MFEILLFAACVAALFAVNAVVGVMIASLLMLGTDEGLDVTITVVVAFGGFCGWIGLLYWSPLAA